MKAGLVVEDGTHAAISTPRIHAGSSKTRKASVFAKVAEECIGWSQNGIVSADWNNSCWCLRFLQRPALACFTESRSSITVICFCFLAPLVCACIDLLAYERVAGLHLIAKYLREYSGVDPDSEELRRYEVFMQVCRAQKLSLPHETRARSASSVVSGIAIPLLALAVQPYRDAIAQQCWLLGIPLLGIVLVIWTYCAAQRQIERIDKLGPGQTANNALRC